MYHNLTVFCALYLSTHRIVLVHSIRSNFRTAMMYYAFNCVSWPNSVPCITSLSLNLFQILRAFPSIFSSVELSNNFTLSIFKVLYRHQEVQCAEETWNILGQRLGPKTNSRIHLPFREISGLIALICHNTMSSSSPTLLPKQKISKGSFLKCALRNSTFNFKKNSRHKKHEQN